MIREMALCTSICMYDGYVVPDQVEFPMICCILAIVDYYTYYIYHVIIYFNIIQVGICSRQ